MKFLDKLLILSTTLLPISLSGQVDLALADTLYNRGELIDATSVYDEVRKNAFEDEGYDVYFRAYGMLLDCLHKTHRLRTLQEELEGYKLAYLKYGSYLPNDKEISSRHVADMFEVTLADARGDLNNAAELLEIIADSLLAINTKNADTYTRMRQFKILLQQSETYYRMGNFESARGYAGKAIELSIPFKGELMNDGLALVPHLILSDIFTQLGEYNDAIIQLETVLGSLPEVSERQTERYVNTYAGLVRLSILRYDTTGAKSYLNDLVKYDRSGLFNLERLTLQGEIAYAQGDLATAEYYYLGARELIVASGDSISEAVGLMDLKLGEIALNKGDPESALRSLNHGLRCFGSASDSIRMEDLYDHINVVDLLLNRSIVEERSGNKMESWKTISTAVQYVERLRSGYNTPEDKAALIEKSYRTFAQAISLCYQFEQDEAQGDWHNSAFQLIERSKALNLLDAVLQGNAKSYAGIPDSLVLEEQELIARINEIRSGIRQARKDGSSQAELRNQDIERFNLEARLLGVYAFYEQEYPDYYRLIQGNKLTALRDAMVSLDRDETVIEYFVGDDKVFVIAFDRFNSKLIKVDSVAQVNFHANILKLSIESHLTGKSIPEIEQMAFEAMSSLYNLLLRPAEPLQNDLIIIPDGSLHKLSFACLTKDESGSSRDMRDLPYLIKKHDISYSYSYALLNEIVSESDDTYINTHVFAPEIDSAGGFAPLPFAISEARFVERISSAEAMIGPSCTAAAVKSRLKEFGSGRLLHFATHGAADMDAGSDSFLQFSGVGDTSRIYAFELYSLPIDYDLVYLSACRTSDGTQIKGEGVVSLARAFFYAGANSLVTAMWSIGDERSSRLTESFYNQLFSGEGIDAAIARSQRTHLSGLSKEDRYLAHPAYWAAMVSYGNTDAIISAGLPLWLEVSAALATLGLLLIFFWRKR